MVEVAHTFCQASKVKDSKEEGFLVHQTSRVTEVILTKNIRSVVALWLVSTNNQSPLKLVGRSLVRVGQSGLGASDKAEQENEED